MNPRAASRAILLAAAAVVLAACSSPSHKASPSPSASVSPTASPTPSPTPTPYLSPLTGLPVKAGLQVIGVKVDNTDFGRPQIGMNAADIVYVEQVEGGLTRTLGMFSSHLPKLIGPIRSVRESDVELMGEYGRVTLAFSGGNPGVKATVHRSNVTDGSYDAVQSPYSFATDRVAPFRFRVDPAKVLALRPSVAARDIGLRFDAAPPTIGTPYRRVSVRYPAAHQVWNYSSTTLQWYLTFNGTKAILGDGSQESASNVIVQFIHLRPSPYHDHNHMPTPYTVSIGTGKAIIFRDGRAIQATWSRSSLTHGTHFKAGGHDVALRPGRTWILLVPVGSPVTAS